VTKSPAKRAAPAKKVAGKAVGAASKAKAAATKKPAKPVAKPARTAAPSKPAPKAAAKPAGKPVAHGAPKASKTAPPSKSPPAKSSAKPPPKPTAQKKPAPAPVPKTEPIVAPKPAAKPVASAAKPAASGQPVLNQPPPRAAPRATPRHAVPAPAPLPEPLQVSRFADRFAPTRPPARSVAVDAPVRPAVKFDPKLVNAWKSKAGRELTEPELLAMPEAEYMNEKQLEFFRTRLTALKDDLLSNAGETTEHLREDTSIVPDPADRATIEEEHALELRTRDRERKLLKKISQSLARIDAGDYGYCDETGEPIGLARLLARPTATLSLEAQQRREMKQKMFGD
jgi:DnaK suppressor protein